MSSTACPPAPVQDATDSTQQQANRREDSTGPQSWNVILHDDSDHTYEYVIRMMMELFAMGPEDAFRVAKCVDEEGRAICLTTHKEHAELKRDQILAYGKDAFLARSKGSMSATIEPAMGGGDDAGGSGPNGPGPRDSNPGGGPGKA